MNTIPYWSEAKPLPKFEPITRDVEVDVVIIGGGLTGITTAHLLKQAGAKVALLERDRCGAADTGHTTAHLTYVTDERLHRLVKLFGKERAKGFWDAGQCAIDEMYRITRNHNIDCEFKWLPGYLHGKLDEEPDEAERDSLEEDANLAKELGFDVEFVESVPYAKRPGVRFAHQARFHPLKYLRPLVAGIPGNGSFVFEQTEAGKIDPDPLTIHANQNQIRCKYLVIATHTPLMGKSSLVSATLFQSKLALYTSYVIGARLPSGAVPEALYWDTHDPYYYLRADRFENSEYCIFGGEDVKTGQEEDSAKVFARLEAKLNKVLPGVSIENRWLGQVVETNDGLPFIGENSAQQFIATGFGGNGFTFGTLSAIMVRDKFAGRKNPWIDLFDVSRKKLHGGTWRYVQENLDYPYYMIRDRLASAESDSVDDLKIGAGMIVKLDGRKVAAYRDESGKVNLLSPVCTHLKCIVRWNNADKTWDCPCHGSRFKPTGEVFSGPAEEPLEKIPWPEMKA